MVQKKLVEALEQIRDRDWVENVLDPQWAPRIAREALAQNKRVCPSCKGTGITSVYGLDRACVACGGEGDRNA